MIRLQLSFIGLTMLILSLVSSISSTTTTTTTTPTSSYSLTSVNSTSGEGRSGRGDITIDTDNETDKLVRDDFNLNEPNNASLYVDLGKINGNQQGEATLFTLDTDNSTSTVSRSAHIMGRSSRALDLDHYLGGSRKARKESGNRESRILNDNIDLTSSSSSSSSSANSGLAIQGFIPIISLSGSPGQSILSPQATSLSTSSSSSSSSNYPGKQSNDYGTGNQGGNGNNNAGGGYQEEGYLPPSSGYAGPNDAKFLGAALQGLTAAFKPKPTSYEANLYESNYFGGAGGPHNGGQPRDCVCVPFYMCKNGYLEQPTRSKSPTVHALMGHRPAVNLGDYDDLVNAQSVMHQYSMPPQLASFYRSKVRQQQHHQPQPQHHHHQQQHHQNHQNQQQPSYQPNHHHHHQQQQQQSNFAQESINNQQYQPAPSQSSPTPSTIPGRLPIDERSIDGRSNRQQSIESMLINGNDTNGQYSSEVLGRIFGSSGSRSNCGVLRTCCRLVPDYPATYEVPSTLLQPQSLYPMAASHDNYLPSVPYNQPPPSPSNSYQGGLIQPPPHSYGYNGGNQPSKRFQPNIDISLIRPKPSGQQMYPGAGHYTGGRPVRPSIKNHQPLPIRPVRPTYTESIAHHQPPPHSHQPPSSPYHQSSYQPNSPLTGPNPLLSHDGQCGIRNAVGIHGRVQNLQYHKSSTEFGEYPWQVAILKRLGPADSLYVCGGTLISAQWIATAAHCIKSNRAEDLKVRLGEWDVHRDDEFYSHVEKFVDEIVVHPEYYPGNLINDIALIRIESPVDLSSPHIAPACIPSTYEKFAGSRCWVTGWGKDSFGTQGEYQSVLKEVDVPILTHSDCEQTLRQTRLGHYYQLHPGFLCAGGEPGKDACEGDGGSPLVCDVGGVWKVAGLVSWGIGCGQPGVPGVYVNVAHYNQWIDSIIGKYGKSGLDSSSSNNLQDPFGGAGIISERSNNLTPTNKHTNGTMPIASASTINDQRQRSQQESATVTTKPATTFEPTKAEEP